MSPDLNKISQDLDIQDAIEEGFPPDDVECTEAVHQTTHWNRGYATWRVTFSLPVPYDSGAITNQIDTQIPYIECDSHRPDGQVTVNPDGSVSLTLKVGPGVEND